MKFNWPKVVKVLREIAVEHIVLEGKDSAHTAQMRALFKFHMQQTDQFHPFDGDADLSAALARMPDYCNYRSLTSFWAWRRGKEEIADAVFLCLEEIGNLVENFYLDRWNHAPGYLKPRVTIPEWDDIALKAVPKIIKAAKA